GKSSLAFDTIYAEGQRRYMESFSAYARQFLGNMQRPDVDQINGLSPVISIEQKTTNTNPRSTVGTITEIYDFMRLLFARAGEAYSYMTGEKMVKLNDEQINKLIYEDFFDKRISVLSPMVKGRKGHYRELFEQVMNMGFLRVRIDGDMYEVKKGLQADRYKVHDIEVVIDRMTVNHASQLRLNESLKLAIKHSKGSLMILDEDSGKVKHFSQHLMCPTTGISYDEPQPNSFSFNSPYGACPKCNGLGIVPEIDIDSVIPDRKKTIKQGGIVPLGEYKENWIFAQITAIGKKHGFTINSKIED
ncbi:MAG TPA: excinuclease ABC subunit UvrA, partial [Bacteroidia bacterium]|nr:excinuclease ABC subunit UvrA [Bacteroidia bacterium]